MAWRGSHRDDVDGDDELLQQLVPGRTSSPVLRRLTDQELAALSLERDPGDDDDDVDDVSSSEAELYAEPPPAGEAAVALQPTYAELPPSYDDALAMLGKQDPGLLPPTPAQRAPPPPPSDSPDPLDHSNSRLPAYVSDEEADPARPVEYVSEDSERSEHVVEESEPLARVLMREIERIEREEEQAARELLQAQQNEQAFRRNTSINEEEMAAVKMRQNAQAEPDLEAGMRRPSVVLFPGMQEFPPPRHHHRARVFQHQRGHQQLYHPGSQGARNGYVLGSV